MYQSNNNLEYSLNQCLLQIQDYLAIHGKKCSSFSLPDPNENEQIDYENEKTMATSFYEKLKRDQKKDVDLIYNSVSNQTNTSKAYFIDGPGLKENLSFNLI